MSTVQRLRDALAGHYRIDGMLGSGAMATVYLARDLRLERMVAVKVLHEEYTASVDAERFLAEIKVTARLHHPHILPLFDSGTADGHLFYVMPFVEGETLRERIRREQQLPVEDATRLIGEVADALAYAHGHGIVHRDIKPENILLAAGHALVADFGIALVATITGEQRISSGYALLGTASYVSPEQVTADAPVDGRSDIYSLGCVLFEALVGEPPWTGPSAQAIIARRFNEAPPSAAAQRDTVPPRLSAAIRKAMARESGGRFQDAAEFARELGAAAVVAPDRDDATSSIAVLPFANMSSDPEAEAFSDGMAEEILNALVRLPGLRVIARTSSFAFKGRNVDVRTVGQKLGAGLVLEGSVRKSGNRLRITAQLVDATRGHHLWSERYDREIEDVFAIQDEITASVRTALSAQMLAIGVARPKGRPEIDADTYDLFLRGKFFVAKRAEGMRKGMECLGQVVARAPTFAPAYAELATAHTLLTIYGAIPTREGWSKVRDLARAALAIDPGLARAHAELGNVAFWFDWDWQAARTHFERALAIEPNDSWVHTLLSHYWSSLGHHDEAVRHGQLAVSLDPLNPSARVSLAITQYVARNYDEVIALCDKIIELDAGYSEAHRMKGRALRELGRLEEALAPTNAAVELSGRHGWAVGDLGILHAVAGRAQEAAAVLEELVSRLASEPIPPLAIALVHAHLHDADRYFEWLGRAIDNRDSWLVMMSFSGVFDPLRHDPRFAKMVRRIGIPV